MHQVRNTLKYVKEKDKKAFANDLKSIYHAPNEEVGCERMHELTEKWHDKYPGSMKRWEENRDVISPMFKFSADIRKVMYTTNVIENLNRALRRLNSQRSVFHSDTALFKGALLFEATKNGQCRSKIGAKYMANCPLCMKKSFFSTNSLSYPMVKFHFLLQDRP